MTTKNKVTSAQKTLCQFVIAICEETSKRIDEKQNPSKEKKGWK